LTLEKLWAVELPPATGGPSVSGKFEGIAQVFFEYVDLCIDWARFVIPASDPATEHEGIAKDDEKQVLKDALQLLLASAIRTKDCKEVKKEVDKERAGIAMWRIP
jgi:hypothetical protein